MQNPGFYQIKLADLRVGSISIGGVRVQKSAHFQANTQSILDTGTTLILLPSALYNAFVYTIKNYYASAVGVSSYYNFFQGKALSLNPRSSWPVLFFTFEGVVVRVPPSVYFLSIVSRGITYYYLGIDSISDNVEIVPIL